MKGGIKGSLGKRMTCERLELARQNPGEIDASRGNTKQEQILAVLNAFQHLTGQPLERAGQILARQNLDSFRSGRGRHGAVAVGDQCMGVDVFKS